MKLAANIGFLYHELPELDRIDAAADDGFTGIECPFPYGLDPSALETRLRGAGVQLVLINTPLGPSGEPGFAAVPGEQTRFRDGFERALALAQQVACPSVHVMAGRPRVDTRRQDEAMQVLIDNLHWAAPLARHAGVVLLLEALNHHDMPGYAYHQPAQVVRILDHLSLPQVRLQFDLFHTAREGLDLSRTLRACAQWIHHVQIADSPDRTQPDLGKPDVARALKTLKDMPYDGWLGLEYRPMGTTAASMGWRGPLRALLDEAPGVQA